VGRSMNAN